MALEPLTVNEPVTLTDPVNCCVFTTEFPNTLDPLLYSTDDVIVCTTNVCAVNVPADVILPVVARDPVTVKLPDMTALPVYGKGDTYPLR